MNIKVDVEKCIGCELCVQIAPEVFELADINGEMKSKVVEGADFEKNKQAILESEEACPVDAIEVEEEGMPK